MRVTVHSVEDSYNNAGEGSGIMYHVGDNDRRG